MRKNTIKYIIDIGLIISFLTVFITGIIKFPALSGYFLAVYRAVPGYYISRIHDISGLIMGILVFIHLSLNWSWIAATTRGFFRK